MTLHEILKSMQDVKLEVHYYKNHLNYKEGCPCKEIFYKSGDSTEVAVFHLMNNSHINWDKCTVFYIGYSTPRSRTLRINVEAEEFND